MGYKEIKELTSGNKKGYVKYDFYFRFRGKKYTRRETCRRSSVSMIYRQWETSIINGQLYSEEKITFFEISEQYLAYVKDTKSARQYCHEVTVMEVAKEFFNNISLSDFTKGLAEDFVQWRKKTIISRWVKKNEISASTLNKNIGVMSSFFNYCIRRELYHRNNPFALMRIPERNYREVRASREQIEITLDEAMKIHPMFYRVILIALLSGMRRGEIFSLEWSEVSLERSMIILSQRKTKSRRSRAVPISPMLGEILRDMKAPGSLVITGYTVDMMKKHWRKLLNSLPFSWIGDNSNMRFHDLRHICLQSLLDFGLQLEDIQMIAGHRDFTTTQRRYAQHARPDLVEKGSKIDKILPLKKVI